MVAYDFQQQFIEPIRTGTKAQTIRADRKRHARPGEELQLYTGMRRRGCQLIARARCAAVHPVMIAVAISRIWTAADAPYHGGDPRPAATWGFDPAIGRLKPIFPEPFAQLDGFADWQAMKRFWEEHHPEASDRDAWFEGVLVRWDPASLATAAAPRAGVDAELAEVGVL